jgi:hypothetical protein
MLKSLLKLLHPRFQNLFLEYKVEFKPRYGHGKPPHKELNSIIELNRKVYEEIIDGALALKENFWTILPSTKLSNTNEPSWNNGFLPGLDVIGIYTMLAKFKPKRYIEIGSGNSTKVAYKAKKEQHLDMEIISIDPMPRAEIDQLADQVIRMRFEDADMDLVNMLNENDILFIDNSHRILPNSDSMVFYMEILSQLKKGVIVHIHDIYLPYDYPQFMCDRFYSEQYGLAFYLMANPKKYFTILPNYFISEDKMLATQLAPIWEHANLQGIEKHGGSFWLKINE